MESLMKVVLEVADVNGDSRVLIVDVANCDAELLVGNRNSRPIEIPVKSILNWACVDGGNDPRLRNLVGPRPPIIYN